MVASSSIDSFKVWRGEGVMLAIIRSPEIMLRESWRNVSFSAPFNVFNQVYPPSGGSYLKVSRRVFLVLSLASNGA
jgi:hypothetical protein